MRFSGSLLGADTSRSVKRSSSDESSFLVTYDEEIEEHNRGVGMELAHSLTVEIRSSEQPDGTHSPRNSKNWAERTIDTGKDVLHVASVCLMRKARSRSCCCTADRA